MDTDTPKKHPELRNAIEVAIILGIEAAKTPDQAVAEAVEALVARVTAGDLPAGYPAGKPAGWARGFARAVAFNLFSDWAVTQLHECPTDYEVTEAGAAAVDALAVAS